MLAAVQDGADAGSAEWAALAEQLTADAEPTEGAKGKRKGKGARHADDEAGAEVVDAVVDHAREQGVEVADLSAAEVQRVVRKAAKDAGHDADQAAADVAYVAQLMASEDGSKVFEVDAEPREGRQTALHVRGPPAGEDEDGRWVDGEWVEYDDSAEQTEDVLEGRIELDESEEDLAEQKKKAASGEISKADYATSEKEHEEREQQYEADRAELSPERAELVDEVVDGHRDLTEREQQLAAEEKKVAGGTVTKKAHEQNVADYEEQRDEVYAATDELMDATDHDAGVVPDEVGGEGAVAGCGSSGVFVECGAVSEDADGERDEDRCVALSGVSAGCGVETSSGESKGSASCTLSGAGEGCGSTTSSRAEDGSVNTASARCTGDASGCGQHSIATTEGSASACRTGGGTCRGESTGPSLEDAEAPPTVQREKSAASAACTGACDLTTFADAGGAEAECSTDAGACNSSSSGAGTDRPDARLAADEDAEAAAQTAAVVRGEDTRRAAGTAHCESATEGCGTSSSVDVGDRWGDEDAEARAATWCAEGATGCSGRASATTGATDRGDADRAAQPAAQPAAPEATTTGTANCTVTGGGCATEARSGERDEDGDRDAGGESAASVDVDCDGPACTGTGRAATTGVAKGLAAGASGRATARPPARRPAATATPRAAPRWAARSTSRSTSAPAS
ncbi:hypothetical protein BJF78_32055 [Pseudonocardia sp. CNS-139]|nr:hypothetical protein BJF78_32055 [Pseudonocardia sp. CNS-139]